MSMKRILNIAINRLRFLSAKANYVKFYRFGADNCIGFGQNGHIINYFYLLN